MNSNDNTVQRSARSQSARTATLVSVGLLVAMLIWTSLPGQIDPETSLKGMIAILTIKLLPLGLVIPGMIRDNLRAYAWFCFLVLMYFTQYVMSAYLTEWQLVPSLITIITITSFLSAMFYIKWQKQPGQAV